MAKPYLCGECGERMTLTLGSVPYPECGLDNVMLDKVPVRQCKNGHRDVQIPAIDRLHLVLAQVICTQPWTLRGQDVRFLRKFLGYSARQFSEAIGLHYVTLSKFENDHEVLRRDTESLIRLFCAVAIGERFKKTFPKPLIPVLQELESGSASLDLRGLRVEHVDLGKDRLAEPQHAWQESTA